MKYDGCYDNKFSPILLFRARSNTLKLNVEKRHKSGDTKCDLCGQVKEDLVHFLLDCKELESKRDKEIMEIYYDSDKEEMCGKILHTNRQIEEVKKMLENMWNCRKIKKEAQRKIPN